MALTTATERKAAFISGTKDAAAKPLDDTTFTVRLESQNALLASFQCQ